jgi:hypothetical protein
MRGHNRVKHFYICYYGENLLKKPLSQKSSNLLARESNDNKEKQLCMCLYAKY